MNRLLLMFLAAAFFIGAAPRSTTDFEIAALEKEIRTANDAVIRSAAQINLGDFHSARGDRASARSLYDQANRAALAESLRARDRSDFSRYARALGYAGLAQAKLSRRAEAIRTLDEMLRYGSDSDVLWNLYASAMITADEPARAVAAARNAVAIAREPLDRSVYRYSLATALAATGTARDSAEAEKELREIITDLEGPAFSGVRRQVEATERFEALSAARGDAAAWVSLISRTRLRLARLLEANGRAAEARAEYESVLRTREDDPFALAGLARLSSGEERRRYFRKAFDSTPFSTALVSDYERFLRQEGDAGEESSPTPSAGDSVRAIVRDLVRERYVEAELEIDRLQKQTSGNQTLAQLRARAAAGRAASVEIPAFLRAAETQQDVEPTEQDLAAMVKLFRNNRIDAASREALERLRFTSTVLFDAPLPGPEGTSTFATGRLGSIVIRFPQPTAFSGSFAADAPLRLQYRIAGVSDAGGREYLVVEPLGVALP